MARWEKEEDRNDAIIWRSRENRRITLEAHKFDTPEDEYLDGKWYVFPAKDSKGIPNSPEIVETKTDAIRELAKLKKVM